METIVKAKTVQDAVAEGAKQLGVAPEDVRYEVIEEAKKGFFGMFSAEATVKVFTEDGAEETASRPEAAPSEAPAPKAAVSPSSGDLPPVQDKIIEFLNTVIGDMGVEANATVVRVDERLGEDGHTYEKDIHVEIVGNGLGMLIGRHGDVLDALQYLCNIVVGRYPKNPDRHEYVRIVLDIENYRAKREDTLKALARRVSSKVLATGRNFTLEPMSAYERRIIHSEVQTISGVHTYSVGADSNRKVVIAYGDDVSDEDGEE